MPELFRWAQVFALPSIVEGSAVSSYEALLSGLPLVVTPNAGTIICGDDAGQIVEPRDTVAIEQALRRYCEEPELLARHREGALSLRKMASTERYGRDLAEFTRQLSK
jgi:glycosyltransferase involved in cell wall biosynthesis